MLHSAPGRGRGREREIASLGRRTRPLFRISHQQQRRDARGRRDGDASITSESPKQPRFAFAAFVACTRVVVSSLDSSL